MSKSNIEWTESTWNPVTGCTKVSPGCQNCYAESLVKRLQGMGQYNYRNGFRATEQPHMLDVPLNTHKPTTFFVNSMSDLFHRDFSIEYIKRVFDVIVQCPQHQFQILTKRSERLVELASELDWSHNIWQGVSVESPDYYFRISDLVNSNAKLKWLSLEPLLAPLPNIPLKGIDWVVVGGETTLSKAGLRPIDPDWVRSIRDQCVNAEVPFFFKQWGGVNARKKANGRLLDGRTWDEYPDALVAKLNRSFIADYLKSSETNPFNTRLTVSL